MFCLLVLIPLYVQQFLILRQYFLHIHLQGLSLLGIWNHQFYLFVLIYLLNLKICPLIVFQELTYSISIIYLFCDYCNTFLRIFIISVELILLIHSFLLLLRHFLLIQGAQLIFALKE